MTLSSSSGCCPRGRPSAAHFGVASAASRRSTGAAFFGVWSPPSGVDLFACIIYIRSLSLTFHFGAVLRAAGFSPCLRAPPQRPRGCGPRSVDPKLVILFRSRPGPDLFSTSSSGAEKSSPDQVSLFSPHYELSVLFLQAVLLEVVQEPRASPLSPVEGAETSLTVSPIHPHGQHSLPVSLYLLLFLPACSLP